MTKPQKILFLSIIILAIFLRFFGLDKFPPSLFSDEVDLGYQAYSLLKTGKDYNGNLLPISFQSFADFRAPLYIYTVVPLVAILGLNEWAVRLPAAFFGILAVYGIYFLVRTLGFGAWVGMISSFLLAISPWHLQYSRVGFEVTLMLSLLILGTACFISGLKNRSLLLISTVLFALTLYSYSTAKLFVPIFVIGLIIIFAKELFKLSLKFKILLIFFFLLIATPMISDTIIGKGLFRFSYTSIFADSTIPKEIDILRGIDSKKETVELGQKSNLISKFSHNKIFSLGEVFLKNYLSAFSTNFLFINGDHIGRHSVGKMGEFYLVEIITFLAGVFWLVKFGKGIQKKLFASWLLLAPIPSSLTVGGGDHATRLILMLPPLIMISALGFYNLWSYLWRENFKKALFVLLIIFFTVNLYFYFHQYYIHHPIEQERLWHYGFKQAILKTENLQPDYEKILFTPTTEPPLIFVLFWTRYDPLQFQGKGFVENLGKYSFLPLGSDLNAEDLERSLDKNTLVVANRKDVGVDLRREKIEGVKPLDIIKYPSGEVAFYILTHE